MRMHPDMRVILILQQDFVFNTMKSLVPLAREVPTRSQDDPLPSKPVHLCAHLQHDQFRVAVFPLVARCFSLRALVDVTRFQGPSSSGETTNVSVRDLEVPSSDNFDAREPGRSRGRSDCQSPGKVVRRGGPISECSRD